MIRTRGGLENLTILLFGLASAALAQQGEVAAVLSAPKVYNSGFGGATQVVTADFNRDGTPDMAVLGPCQDSHCGAAGYGSVAVLLGAADGSFQAPVIYATGTINPHSLAVGDFNGDGAPDLAVVSQCLSQSQCGSGAVQVFLGNGDGTLRNPVSFAAGTGASYFVATGDFNRDGKLDLVVANQTAANSTINVLAGKGDGSFAAPVSFSTGAPSAVFITVADFNNDGTLDLAVVNGGTQDSVSILLGNPDGTFQPPMLYAAGGALAASAAAGDLNGDGAADLVVVNACANYDNLTCAATGSIGVLRGNGDGTFQPTVSYSSGGSNSSFVALGDFDGDGKPDLAVVNAGAATTGGLSLLTGKGDGTFQPAVAYQSGGNSGSSLAMMDLDGDGRPDLAVSNQCISTDNCANGVAAVLLNSASSFLKRANDVTLTASPNPAAAGQTVIITAKVNTSPNAGLPTGEIAFYDGAALLSTVPLIGGQVSFSTSPSQPGSHPIQAAYTGDANYAAGKSAVLTEIVGTPVTLSSSAISALAGQPVTFTARVAGNSVTPTGSVTFMDGSALLESSRLLHGIASITTSALAAGAHAITASYGGDPNFPPGAGSLSQTIGQSSVTTVESSANPARVNQPVTFKAKVTGPQGGAASGAVAFMQGNPPATWGTAPLVNGEATISTAFNKQKGGATPITAAYLGGPAYQSSRSSTLHQSISADQAYTTTTTLTSSGTDSLAGQPVTFTATVTSTGGSIPDGETVTFFNGSNTLGSSPTAGGGATFTTSSLPVGTNIITATYAGDATFSSSTSNPLSQVVNLNPTTTTLGSNVNPSTYGQAVTFTAVVAPTSGTGTPTGQVTFKNGSAVFGTGALANGTASITTATLASGSLNITASYSGDPTYAGSSATLAQVVSLATTTTLLTASPNPAAVNATITLTATVTGQYNGSTTGTVTFMQGANTLGSAAPSHGKATFTTSFSATGTYPISAIYSGDSNNQGSTSAVVNETVNAISTTMTLTTSGTPSLIAQPVTFTATITPSSGAIPNGETVTFDDGSVAIGTGATANGVAAFTTSSLAVGTHNITAIYAGDANYQAVTSKVLKQVVNLVGTSTALASSLNPSIYGQSVTLTATVTPTSGTGTPTGTVTFKKGSTYLGSVTLTGNVAAYTSSTLAAGSAAITATYSGDATYSTSNTTLTQVVNQAATATSLTASPNPVTINKTVTLTAYVTAPYGGTLTGSVAFMQGSATLGTAALSHGKASFSTSFPAAGTIQVTAVYPGDANNQTSTSSPVSETVNDPTTTTTLATSGSPAYVGQTVTFTATVSSTYGAIPDGETVTFLDGSNTIGTGSTAGGVAKFATSSLTSGTHSITASYPGDSTYQPSTSHVVSQSIQKNTVTVTLTPNANPSVYGLPVTFTVTVTSSGPAPTGTVTVKNSGASLGTASLNSQGAAAVTTVNLGAGSYGISASYSGDSATASGTSATLNEVITPAATSLQLVSSINPAAVGSAITFTAIVRSTTAFATGSVTFTSGSTTLGSASLVNGAAKLTISTLPSGSSNITATYAGTTSIAGSSASLVQYVE